MARSMIPFGWTRSPLTRRGGDTDPFRALHQEMNRLFEEMTESLGTPAAGGAAASAVALAPSIDISETEQDIRICAELPGVDQKDVEITLAGEVLTLRAEKRAEQEEKRQNYHLVERSFGTFARSLRLPFAADPDQVKASFRNGVLTVTVPKPQEAQEKSRRIQVQGESDAQQTIEGRAESGSGQSSGAGKSDG